jgi:hypothetical protein
MKIPLLALIFQGIPEQIAVATLAFVIANIPLSWKKIMVIGVILAVSSYLIRLMPITFGIPTVLLMGVLCILLLLLGKSNLNSSLLASLLSFLSLIIAETVAVAIQTNLLKISIEAILNNLTLRIITGYPHILIILGLAAIIYKIKNSNLANKRF